MIRCIITPRLADDIIDIITTNPPKLMSFTPNSNPNTFRRSIGEKFLYLSSFTARRT